MGEGGGVGGGGGGVEAGPEGLEVDNVGRAWLAHWEGPPSLEGVIVSWPLARVSEGI